MFIPSNWNHKRLHYLINFIKRFLIIDKVRIYFEYNIHCFHVIARGISAMAITELQASCNNVAFSYKNVRIIIIIKKKRSAKCYRPSTNAWNCKLETYLYAKYWWYPRNVSCCKFEIYWMIVNIKCIIIPKFTTWHVSELTRAKLPASRRTCKQIPIKETHAILW